MCETGININQMKLAVGQTDDALAMAQQWLEQLHHLADHGHRAETSTLLAQANVLLGDARAKLDAAIEDLEGDGSAPATTVELV